MMKSAYTKQNNISTGFEPKNFYLLNCATQSNQCSIHFKTLNFSTKTIKKQKIVHLFKIPYPKPKPPIDRAKRNHKSN